MIPLDTLFDKLIAHYGPQGWWPLLDFQENDCNPTMRGKFTGYHPNDYSLPITEDQTVEIMIGAILTQNTSWSNAERALMELKESKCLNFQSILDLEDDDLAELIRSSGYFNQKIRYLKNLATFLKENQIKDLLQEDIKILRKKILDVKGIGPETADSILLYALKKEKFVIDTYTKRILYRIGMIESHKAKYDKVQELFETFFHTNKPTLSIKYTTLSEIYNEYHALLVQHATQICKKTPECQSCFLNKENLCAKNIIVFKKRKKKK